MEENHPTTKDNTSAIVPSKNMIIFNILYSLVPLLGFWIIEEWYGLTAGIVAAIILGVGEIAWVFYKEKRPVRTFCV